MEHSTGAMSTSEQDGFEKFDAETMNIEVYLEQFSAHCETWNIESSKKVTLLISLFGHELYSLLRDLLAADSVKD